MANRKMTKIPLDGKCLMESLHLRNTSIRKLGADFSFGWSSKSIERGIKEGEISPDLLDALGKYLDVDPDYLSGKYHRECENLKIDVIRTSYRRSLCAAKYPYMKKQQRKMYDGKFLYDKYLEHILVIHDISIHQFEALTLEHRKELQLRIEKAIVPVLMDYFPKNAMGQDIWPDIYELQNSIDNYDPNEPEPPDDFFDNDTEDPFADKYPD